jgi:hypothetical protein
MVNAIVLKMQRGGHIQWLDLPVSFHENLPVCSKVISGGYIDGQADSMVIS